MVNFFGIGSGKLDDKGRIVLPAVFKSALLAEARDGQSPDMRLMVRKDIYAGCLEIYSWAEWERIEGEIRSRLDIVFNEAHAAFWRKYMDGCAAVIPDEKYGRLSIPKELLDSIGVTKEVVFAGVGFKIELWAKERREEGLISEKEYKATAVELSSQR